MIGKIIKQPNGKYALWESFESLKINLSNEDIISLYILAAKNKAEKDIEDASGIGEILKAEIRQNKTFLSDEQIKEMGLSVTKKELIKYVPLVPKNKNYAPCDFTTYAKCPSCNALVRDSIGGKDEKCNKCGQRLNWE